MHHPLDLVLNDPVTPFWKSENLTVTMTMYECSDICNLTGGKKNNWVLSGILKYSQQETVPWSHESSSNNEHPQPH